MSNSLTESIWDCVCGYSNSTLVCTKCGKLEPSVQEESDRRNGRIAALERDLAAAQEEMAWIRKKLKLPEDAKMFVGQPTIAGALHVICSHAHGYETYITSFKCDDKQGEIARLTVELDRLRARLLTAAGDDLCRLTQEEIKAMSAGAVKIPPKDEFLASCERFHAQVANEAGVMTDCLTLAQLVAENERLTAALAEQRRLNAEVLQDFKEFLWQNSCGCKHPACKRCKQAEECRATIAAAEA
jgi:hypothetical protein